MLSFNLKYLNKQMTTVDGALKLYHRKASRGQSVTGYRFSVACELPAVDTT